jgi:small nuclear ribonucleoprotein (snRNP)-like protein
MVRKSIGEKLVVRLRNKTEIGGRLVAYDEHLNMMIEEASIQREGQTQQRNLMYLRGDGVVFLGRKE